MKLLKLAGLVVGAYVVTAGGMYSIGKFFE